ncbi:MAG: M55 family metallopeptidase [Lentisphaeria bacterium]|nr:M55 family metallopeptidase [Lentisphaeria bacterium]
MKVFILTDLEGPSGVNGRADSIGNTMVNRPTAEQALVNEVNAVCEGLVAAGADEIVVLDGHGGSNSIDIFKLHPQVSLMQIGQWRPVVDMDGSYDAFIQLGAHSMQSADGYMCHTFNSHAVAEMCLNGEQIGEIGMASLIAAYFKVPTIMVSGDDIACHEARAFLGDDLEVVATKSSISRYDVVNYPPQEVYRNLRETAERALRNVKKYKAMEMADSYELIVRSMCPNLVNAAEKLGIERLDEVTLRYVSDDFIEIWAQRLGWAPGVHKRKYNITPEWKHPHTLAREAFNN